MSKRKLDDYRYFIGDVRGVDFDKYDLVISTHRIYEGTKNDILKNDTGLSTEEIVSLMDTDHWYYGFRIQGNTFIVYND